MQLRTKPATLTSTHAVHDALFANNRSKGQPLRGRVITYPGHNLGCAKLDGGLRQVK